MNGAVRDPAWTMLALSSAQGKWDGVVHLIQGKMLNGEHTFIHLFALSATAGGSRVCVVCEDLSEQAWMTEQNFNRVHEMVHIAHMPDVKLRG